MENGVNVACDHGMIFDVCTIIKGNTTSNYKT